MPALDGGMHVVHHGAQLEAKYDKDLEKTLKAWIESTTGDKIGDDFQAGLKNGVILCKCDGSWSRSCTDVMQARQRTEAGLGQDSQHCQHAGLQAGAIK